MDGLLAEGRAARKAGSWDQARTAFPAALDHGEPPAALEGLGEVLWWLGEPRASLAYHRRAYVAYRRAGDVFGAARTAIGVSDGMRRTSATRPSRPAGSARADASLPISITIPCEAGSV